MATYKAEFMHHYYEGDAASGTPGKRRPMAHYSMGWLPRWLRLAAATRTVPLLNAGAKVPPLAALAKRLGGLAPERDIPALPRTPFTHWWRKQPDRAADGGKPVVLWPDTFTNYLSPEAGSAAVQVFRDAGLRPVVPPKQVCCGLTYVSTGQLDRARAVMRRTLDVMEPALDAGLPVAVLEPPCAAALQTDVPELLGDDPRAKRLAEAVRTFAQTLEEQAPDWEPPRIDRPVAGQTHCHQHAVIGDAAERGGCGTGRVWPATSAAAAAAWPATSASRRATTRCPRPVPRTSSSRPCAPRSRAPRSSPTATPAAPRWTSWAASAAGTWRRCWRPRA